MTDQWVLSNYISDRPERCFLCEKPATKLVDKLVVIGKVPVCNEHDSPLKKDYETGYRDGCSSGYNDAVEEIEMLREALQRIADSTTLRGGDPFANAAIAREALEKKP